MTDPFLGALLALTHAQRPLTADQARAAWTLAATGEYPASSVRCAIAARTDTPADVLSHALVDADVTTRRNAMLNPSTPLPQRLDALRMETDEPSLVTIARTATDPDLLTALAGAVAWHVEQNHRPRPGTTQLWENLRDHRYPAAEQHPWEAIAWHLLTSAPLPTPAARQLVIDAMAWVKVDADTYDTTTGSICFDAIATYAQSDPDGVIAAVETVDHPWLLALAASLPEADAPLLTRAYRSLVEPALPGGPTTPPPNLGRDVEDLIVAIHDRLEPTLHATLLRRLEYCDLGRIGSRLDRIAHPAPTPTTSDDTTLEVFRTGTHEEVLRALRSMSPMDDRALRSRAALAYLSRDDVTAAHAKEVRTQASLDVRAALDARPGDREFAVLLLADQPALAAQTTDLDLLLDVVRHMTGKPGGGGLVSGAASVVHHGLHDILGERLLELPLPALCALAGHHTVVDDALLETLTLLADPTHARVWDATAAAHQTSTLPALKDAMTATTTGAGVTR